ncbi:MULTISPECIES: lipase family protein [unclassified Nocardioides]|uniref:lipase family protein n=1 Tax=unclassified Nocardioides TaxID=2615069 RepID=UPI0006F49B9D|nr:MULTISPECIES: lipase family protein [unclassified Nocardioides]KRA37663.1 lipase [Nocardioides sp. Root614]KRA91623.1 lipase [Nocardioides sp. Root682]
MQPLPDQASAPAADAKRSRPLLPQDDPFLAAPVDLALLAPGAIIRSREVELGFLGLIPQQVSAWQLVYRSTDLHGAPEAAVTTVVLPEGADPNEPRPLLAYQCAIDAITGKAFPSYALRQGARSWGSIPPLEFALLAGVLRKGWALSLADHEGLLGRFGAAREPGYRVLDGIRAAVDFEPLGLGEATPVGIMGYSGGGMASSWAAEMAPTYAPELNIVGAALGAPVGDPGETFIRLNGTSRAGLPAMVVAGLRSGYPGLAKVINEHASFTGRKHLQRLEKSSTLAAVIHHRGHDFDDYLDAPLADVLGTPEVLHVFEDLRLGQHIPTCPILMTQATHDQIIHVEDVDGQQQRYVEGGATVHYVRDRTSEHLSLHPLALPLMIGWMADRFAGKPAPSGTRTVWSVALSVRSLWGYVGLVSAAIRTVAGRPLSEQ